MSQRMWGRGRERICKYERALHCRHEQGPEGHSCRHHRCSNTTRMLRRVAGSIARGCRLPALPTSAQHGHARAEWEARRLGSQDLQSSFTDAWAELNST